MSKRKRSSDSDSRKKARHLSIVADDLKLPEDFCETVRERLKTREGTYDISKQVWVETREHLRGYIHFTKPVYYESNKWNNLISDILGAPATTKPTSAINACKELLECTVVCMQQDGIDILTYKENHDDHVSTKKKRTSEGLNIVMRDIRKGKIKSLEDVKTHTDEGTLSVAEYLRHKRSLLEEIREQRERDRRNQVQIPWEEIPIRKNLDPAWQILVKWANAVIRKDMNMRDKHMWVYGPTQMGKSSRFKEPLMRRLNCWEITKDPVQNKPYISGVYDLIIADEFSKPYKTAAFINELCDPSGCLVRQTGGTHAEKTVRSITSHYYSLRS